MFGFFLSISLSILVLVMNIYIYIYNVFFIFFLNLPILVIFIKSCICMVNFFMKIFKFCNTQMFEDTFVEGNQRH